MKMTKEIFQRIIEWAKQAPHFSATGLREAQSEYVSDVIHNQSGYADGEDFGGVGQLPDGKLNYEGQVELNDRMETCLIEYALQIAADFPLVKGKSYEDAFEEVSMYITNGYGYLINEDGAVMPSI